MGDEILLNRKATYDWHILETYEAGVALKGSEVKSLRLGRGNLTDALARVEGGEVWLYGCEIQPYAPAAQFNHESKARRKLLLRRPEIRKLFEATALRARRLIGLKMYWKNGKVKVLLGVGEAKTKGDKRQSLKKKAAQREIDQAMKSRGRRPKGSA